MNTVMEFLSFFYALAFPRETWRSLAFTLFVSECIAQGKQTFCEVTHISRGNAKYLRGNAKALTSFCLPSHITMSL